ncbi:MAG: DUF4381 domain-containing protein [Shewanella sp.]|nr:DUF4381 domain-containing protein [Shewanella sp.]MCF1430187.1 DUF4381 domain-containing protein [Shewanella sp.]MCF1437537.1 DUF4381 domain-containing protein [Shewanella sp.]MCF1459006.1 DUF4381 domain-containing protein [Shewanella sp.]
MTATPAANVPANPALTQLKDIHLPEQVGLWPLAPGYYLLIALMVLALLAVFLRYRRRQARLAACQQAKHLLVGLDMTSADYAQRVNTLLKRAALSYLPRAQVAALDDAAWLSLLSQSLDQAQRQEISALLGNRFSPRALTPQQAASLKSLAVRILEQLPTAMANVPSREAKSC